MSGEARQNKNKQKEGGFAICKTAFFLFSFWLTPNRSLSCPSDILSRSTDAAGEE